MKNYIKLTAFGLRFALLVLFYFSEYLSKTLVRVNYPNYCYCDVDNIILENRVEKYRDDIIQRIKEKLLEEKLKIL